MKYENKVFKLKMVSEKDKSSEERRERRRGRDRRKFSYGHKGTERRDGSDRREKNKWSN